MLFNSLAFAKVFAAVFVVSWLLSRQPRLRFAFLTLASYAFYCGVDVFAPLSGEPLSAPYLKFAPIVFFGSTTMRFL